MTNTTPLPLQNGHLLNGNIEFNSGVGSVVDQFEVFGFPLENVEGVLFVVWVVFRYLIGG